MKEPTVVEAVVATTRRTRNLSAMLRQSVKRSPHKPAVICGDVTRGSVGVPQECGGRCGSLDACSRQSLKTKGFSADFPSCP